MANIIQMNSGMGWDVSYKRINTNFNALNNELAQVNLTAEQKIAQANANAQTLAAQAQAREEDKLAAIYEQINLTNQALIDKAQEITDHFADNLENVRTEVEESQSSWARKIIGEDIDAEGTEWKTLTQLKQDYSTISSTVEKTQKTLSEEYATKSEVTQKAAEITLSIKGSLDSDMQNLGYKTASQLSIEDGSIKSDVEAKIDSALAEGGFITKTNFEQTYKGFTWSVTKSDVEDAAKTATSFMDYNETHSGALTLGYKQNGALADGTHAVLDNDSLDFHQLETAEDGTRTDTTVASFGAHRTTIGSTATTHISMESEGLTVHGADTNPAVTITSSSKSGRIYLLNNNTGRKGIIYAQASSLNTAVQTTSGTSIWTSVDDGSSTYAAGFYVGHSSTIDMKVDTSGNMTLGGKIAEKNIPKMLKSKEMTKSYTCAADGAVSMTFGSPDSGYNFAALRRIGTGNTKMVVAGVKINDDSVTLWLRNTSSSKISDTATVKILEASTYIC